MSLPFERAQGVIKVYRTDKGFGFAQRESGPDVFVHANDLKRSGIDGGVKEGDVLEFDMVPVAGKGLKACNIRFLASGD